MKLAIIASHTVQYNSPWFRHLATQLDLHVYYMHEVKVQGTDNNEFGQSFEWDTDLLSGYAHTFLNNLSAQPGVNHFKGCDVPEVSKIIKQGGFDAVLVMGWYLKGYLQAAFACKRYKVPVWVRGDSKLEKGQSGLKSLIKRFTFPAFLRLFNRFLYVGHSNKAYLKHYGVSERRLVFCPHFIDQSAFSNGLNLDLQQSLVSEFNLKASSVKVLFVGKFIEKKRVLDILKAMLKLTKANLVYELLLVGSGSTNDVLNAFCLQHPEIKVHFLGFRNQSQLPSIYDLADMLVLPSQGDETWGLVVNEAFSVLTPVIVSDEVGCYPDLIESGKTGEVYKCGNISALAEKIDEVASYSGSKASKAAIGEKNAVYSLEYATEQVQKLLSGYT